MKDEERRSAQALGSAKVVLVSACLVGERCRYDGQTKRSAAVLEAIHGLEVVPICPEAGAGLSIPRPAVELVGGGGAEVLEGTATARVVGTGEDRTQAFLAGAQLAVEASRRFGATVAVLKERSPSCGVRQVQGTWGPLPGQGVAAAALLRAGVRLLSDEEVAAGKCPALQ